MKLPARLAFPLPVVLALLCIAALALFSVLTLEMRSVAADEFSMYWAAEQSPADIVRLYLSPRENNPPGMALVQHYWGGMFGYSDASLRSLSVLLVLASLMMLWRLIAMFSASLQIHDYSDRVMVFIIAGTTPLVWMSANIARYQSLAMLLGLAGLYWYVLWLREKNVQHLVFYALSAALMFYVHYLSAAVFALCAGLHYVLLCVGRVRKKRENNGTGMSNEKNAKPIKRNSPTSTPQQTIYLETESRFIPAKELLMWGASQVAILLCILPLIVAILTAYTTINLSVSAPTAQSNGIIAAIMFFSATVIGIMNGFAVAPWSFWVVLPMAFVMMVLGFIAIRRTELLNNHIGWMFVVLPLVIMSVVVVRMYPPLNIYLIPSVQRVPFLAPLVWMFLGFTLLRLSNRRLQMVFCGVILCCNVYAIAIWNLNIVATQHTPPLREVTEFTRLHTKSDSSTVIAHTVAYRYGMEGVNSISAGSKNAVERYMPEIRSLYWAETDIAKEVSLDSCSRLVRAMNARHWVIVQRNRYPVNAIHLAEALKREGYTQTAEMPAQAQAAFDVWIKSLVVKLPLSGFKDEAAPQPYLYTLQHFQQQ